MVLETPIQSKEVTNDASKPIREEYADYEATFIMLHPFLKVKEGYDIRFDRWKRPTKNELCVGTIPVNWSQIVKEADLKDIRELDSLLAYLHCARMIADRDAWIRFMNYVKRNELVVSQVDDFPPVLINPLLELFASLGYKELFIYHEFDERNKSSLITELIGDENYQLVSRARILTPDDKIFVVTEFDERVTRISSDKATLAHIVHELGVDGFYCDETTKAGWSFQRLKGNTIDWSSPERKM